MTIAQQIKWDFKTNGSLEIKNKNGKRIYWETSGFWIKREYDSQGNYVYYEDSTGVIIDNPIPEIIEHKGRKYQLIR